LAQNCDNAAPAMRNSGGWLLLAVLLLLLLLLLYLLLLHAPRLRLRPPLDLVGFRLEVIGKQAELPRGFKVETGARQTHATGGLVPQILGNHGLGPQTQ
jgi:uncharacterized protein (DUF58 family)